jgi:hypothetical protein
MASGGGNSSSMAAAAASAIGSPEAHQQLQQHKMNKEKGRALSGDYGSSPFAPRRASLMGRELERVEHIVVEVGSPEAPRLVCFLSLFFFLLSLSLGFLFGFWLEPIFFLSLPASTFCWRLKKKLSVVVLLYGLGLTPRCNWIDD